MEDYRSKSYGDGRMQIQPYYGGGSQSSRASSYGSYNPQDHRSYSTSYASSMPTQQSYYGGSQSTRASSYGSYQDHRSYSTSYASSMPTQQSYYGGSQSTRASSYGSYQDHRSYSTSYASSMPTQQPPIEPKLKKGKSSGSNSKIWNFNDPELQRKKRVASYKVYSVEGKVKGSFRKNWRWFKDRYSQVVYGWW